jgi:hypothetical protein
MHIKNINLKNKSKEVFQLMTDLTILSVLGSILMLMGWASAIYLTTLSVPIVLFFILMVSYLFLKESKSFIFPLSIITLIYTLGWFLTYYYKIDITSIDWVKIYHLFVK